VVGSPDPDRQDRRGRSVERFRIMELIIFLLVVFVVFLVAGWGWRKGRTGV
jgi:hypothetical protein